MKEHLKYLVYAFMMDWGRYVTLAVLVGLAFLAGWLL